MLTTRTTGAGPAPGSGTAPQDRLRDPLGSQSLDDPLASKASTESLASDAVSASEPAGVVKAGLSGGGGPLPHHDAIQSSFGHHDLGGVEAHVGGSAGAAAQQLGASGFAVGRQVGLAGGDLHTAAHEAAHVVQQEAGLHLKSADGGGDRLETHADQVADRVVQGGSAEALLDSVTGGATDSAGQAEGLQFSGFEDKTTYLTYIYLLKDDQGYIRYVGKTYQKPSTRKGQHDQSHPERADYDLEIADSGNWTQFETATFEQWYINRCGGTAVLDNKINGITKVKYDLYKHLHSNYCPVWG